MAIYHFSAKAISRAAGSSALAAAAYRAGEKLHDDRLGRTHDFTNKAGVVHSEIMLPEGANEAWTDREKLWNDVEAAELRKDSQLAREIEFALPREMTQAQAIELARDFVKAEFVERGMIADLNVHWDIGADGEAKPHAHVMLTMREIVAGEDGNATFGAKVRDWNRTELLTHWREAWADHANQRMAELDIDARIDHRSLAAQGIDLEPQSKIGATASRMAGEGLSPERLAEHADIARSNGEKIIADPNIALTAITHQQATFTTRDLAMFAHRHSADKDQFDAVMSAVKNAPQLVALGKDGKGNGRFTSREMIETEQRLERATIRLEARRSHAVPERYRELALATAKARGMDLSAEQRGALEHVTSAKGVSNVIGYAGTGKSAMLGVAREAWERAGYTVQGAALSGIAAEGLEHGSRIPSRTLASLEYQWGQGRELLTSKHILVIDEAGMLGTRQMERVVSHAQQQGAKVVMVGDPQQLQAIEAGAAFRAAAERHGAVEIASIRRQHVDWQREATRELAAGRTGEALGRYEEAGHVHVAETRAAARAALVYAWDRDRKAKPDASRIILTHTNDEVKALNEAVREKVRASGDLGDDVALKVERGARQFADGDRVMFLKNERSLGVKNGSLGTIESVSALRMAVKLDDGKAVAFDLKDYAHLDHGYAATIHKAQGMTVDQVKLLATPGMDSHGAYVALSRHRTQVDLHYGKDDFADRKALVRTLSRERGKDMASDYARQPEKTAEVLQQRDREVAPDQVQQQPRPNMFAGLKVSRSGHLADLLKGVSAAPQRDPVAQVRTKVALPQMATDKQVFDKAVQRFARVAQDIVAMRDKRLKPLASHRTALNKAGAELNALRPDSFGDLRKAVNRDLSLIPEVVKGRTDRAIQAMEQQSRLRIEAQRVAAANERRADAFVDQWQRQSEQYRALRKHGSSAASDKVRASLVGMAKGLERDPQLESVLAVRRQQLGLDAVSTKTLSQDLQKSLGLSRGSGMGL
ncbi:Ti-type conjugative transfer relaxase TraA [Blastomonas fulva]|uniref:Ti-type conjugative transfer relaxase TraA n=1 Tax=Blastomonas fulva TaxID=1550728 RepID=A0ABN5B5U3_9SPHN|nr:Ti-type conjugative transfer relaxase TraA [Blastomonas fulva]ASR52452.1 Ti-type conjugative transfer relaxase TraA [Blastomonas fulva]